MTDFLTISRPSFCFWLPGFLSSYGAACISQSPFTFFSRPLVAFVSFCFASCAINDVMICSLRRESRGSRGKGCGVGYIITMLTGILGLCGRHWGFTGWAGGTHTHSRMLGFSCCWSGYRLYIERSIPFGLVPLLLDDAHNRVKELVHDCTFFHGCL